MSKRNGNKQTCDIAVDFGGVSIGKATTRLGVKIDRSRIDLLTADAIFCGHRLTGKVVLGNGEDQDGQGTLVDDLFHEVEGHFDCKRMGVNNEAIGIGLTFSLADIDVAELAQFSKGSGRLVVDEVGEIPDDAPDHDNEERNPVGPPGSLKATGPWKRHKLNTIFEEGKAIEKTLKASGITTMGQLHDWTASGNEITDIPGVGPAMAEKISDGTLRFWQSNPDFMEEPEGEPIEA